MKSKQSIYIPFVKGNRTVGEHTIDLMRQLRKGVRPSLEITSDGTVELNIAIEVDTEAPVAAPVAEAPVEEVSVEGSSTPTWNTKTKKADLILIVEEAGLEVPDGATKADILELLEGL
jgi:hypothetical protein